MAAWQLAIAVLLLILQISGQQVIAAADAVNSASNLLDSSTQTARSILQSTGQPSGNPSGKPSGKPKGKPKAPAPSQKSKGPTPPKKPDAPKPPKKKPHTGTPKPTPPKLTPKGEAPLHIPTKWPPQRPASHEPRNPYPGGIAPGFSWSPKAKDPNVKTVTVGYGSGYTYPVPAGSKDALPQIQDALKALAKTNGGIVKIGPGTFILSDKFRFYSNNTWLTGAGMNETVLRLADNAAPWQSSGFLRALRTENVTVSHLTLDGNKNKQVNGKAAGYGRFCVFLAIYSNWKFDGVRCTRWLRYGFDPHGKKPKDNNYKEAIWGYGLTVVNCMSDNNNWDGFTLDQTYFVYAARNFATKNGRYGYNVVTGSRHVLLEDNVSVDDGHGAITPEWKYNGGHGCGFQVDTNIEEIYGFETYNVTLRNNFADRSFRSGFCVKDQRYDGTLIENNRVTNSGACGNWKRVKYTTFKNNKCGPGNKAKFTTESDDPNSVNIVGNIFVP